MKQIRHLIVAAVFVISAMACSKEPSSARADSSTRPASPPVSVVDKAKPDSTVTVPPGTKLRVSLLDGVSSDKSRSGDQFLASLTEPVVVDGQTVLAKGTKVRGRVVNAQESGRVKGRASLELKLTEIVRDDGKPIVISTKPYTAVADAGTGAVLAPKGKEVRFAPEHLMSFALANPIVI